MRWNTALSKSIHVGCGVRQEGVISLSVFNIFVNAIVMNMKLSDHECHSNNTFSGCAMFADDLTIISAS